MKLNRLAAAILLVPLVASALHPVSAQERRFVGSERLTLGTETNRSASLRIADFDGDRNLDIVVANGRHWPQRNYLFFNQGGGRFNVQRQLGGDLRTSYATEVADLDGDGDLDIAVGNDRAPNRVFLNDGKGRFTAGASFGQVSSVRSLTLADIDRDGDIDILSACRGRPNQIHLNDGSARFATGIPFGKPNDSTIRVAAADLNGDRRVDLILANRDDQRNFVLLNRGRTNNGRLEFGQPRAFGSAADPTRDVKVADLNRDGKLDWVVANIGAANAVYLGDGKGGVLAETTFGDAGARSYALTLDDMDLDGDVDVIVGNVGAQNIVWLNRGDGRQFDRSPFGLASSITYGLATGDVNGDNYPDIAVANSGTENRIYLNAPKKK